MTSFGVNRIAYYLKVKKLHPSKLSWSIIFLTGQRQWSCKGISKAIIDLYIL